MSHDVLIRRALLHSTPAVARPGYATGGANPGDIAGGGFGTGNTGGNAGAAGSAGGNVNAGSSPGGGSSGGGGGGNNAPAGGGMVREGGFAGAGTAGLSASAAAQRPSVSPGAGNIAASPNNGAPAGGFQPVNRAGTTDRLQPTPSQQLNANLPDIMAQANIPSYNAIAGLLAGQGAVDMSVMNALNPAARNLPMNPSPGFSMPDASAIAHTQMPGQLLGMPTSKQPVSNLVGSSVPQTGFGPRQVVVNSAAKGDLQQLVNSAPKGDLLPSALTAPKAATVINRTSPPMNFDPLAAAEISASAIPSGWMGPSNTYNQPTQAQTVGNLVGGLGGAYPASGNVMPESFNINKPAPTAAETAAANAQLDAMMSRAMQLSTAQAPSLQVVNSAAQTNPAGTIPQDLDIGRALAISTQYARPTYDAGYFNNGYTPDVVQNRVSVTPAGDARQNFGPVSATPDSDYREPPSHPVVNDEAGNSRGEGGINRRRKYDTEAAAAADKANTSPYPLMLQPLPDYVPYELPTYNLPPPSPLVQQYINSISGNNSIANALRSAIG
jgi:hypothetical protein